jgi:hypothetical protein
VITVEIVTAITIEIATAMVVIQTGTATGAMTGIETGIGEIAIAAIGTAIDKLNGNFRNVRRGSLNATIQPWILQHQLRRRSV